MLEKILKHIATGGLHNYTELSRELGVSESLLVQMLQDLERMGYLERIENACEKTCERCDLSSSCAIQGSGVLWRLSGKKLPF